MDEQRLDKAKADGSNPFSSTKSLREYLEISFNSSGFVIPKNTKGITKDILLDSIASGVTSNLGYTSSGGFIKFIYKVFPNKPKNIKYISYLLSLIHMKLCFSCSRVLVEDCFHSNSSRIDGLSVYCKDCERVQHKEPMVLIQANRRAAKIQRTPKWADLEKIKEIYHNCPEGMHVDHIIPLQGSIVSGLHVENNLQYLSASDNLRKGNYYES